MKSSQAVTGLMTATLVLALSGCDNQSSPVEAVATARPAMAMAPGDSSQPPLPGFCAADTYERTPEQVLDDHRNAMAIGDLDSVFCNYAVDAVVISDGGIDEGQDQIRSSLEFLLNLFGGTLPVVVQQIVVEVPENERRFPPAAVLHDSNPIHMVRLLFTIDTPCVIVPDGIDTYVIRAGQIHAQTSHAFPVFQCI